MKPFTTRQQSLVAGGPFGGSTLVPLPRIFLWRRANLQRNSKKNDANTVKFVAGTLRCGLARRRLAAILLQARWRVRQRQA